MGKKGNGLDHIRCQNTMRIPSPRWCAEKLRYPKSYKFKGIEQEEIKGNAWDMYFSTVEHGSLLN